MTATTTRPTKICTRCKRRRSLTSFYFYKGQKNAHDYQCRDCRRLTQDEWRATIKERLLRCDLDLDRRLVARAERHNLSANEAIVEAIERWLRYKPV